MISKLWGKTPNVLEQRLLVALYEARRPMTPEDIVELARNLGLMNVHPNLAALRDKGLVASEGGKDGRHSLTPAGSALTKVALEHNLFATPQELQALVRPQQPRMVTQTATPQMPKAGRPPQQPAKSPIAEELQRNRSKIPPPTATGEELRRDFKHGDPAVINAAPLPPTTLAQRLSQARASTSAAPVVQPVTKAVVEPVVQPPRAEPPKPDPPKPEPPKTQKPPEAPKPVTVAKPTIRRAPPPPPRRFSK